MTPPVQPRLPYAAPELDSLGSIEELTQGTQGSGNLDAGGGYAPAPGPGS
jgi:hypothetical protein